MQRAIVQDIGPAPKHHHSPPTMATLTAPAIATLDDLIAHPLCSVTCTGIAVEDEYALRFHLIDPELGDDLCDDSEVVAVGCLYVAAARPFQLVINEPFDHEAADRDEWQDRQDLRDLWAAHGPGR